jgi:hypothetical protein
LKKTLVGNIWGSEDKNSHSLKALPVKASGAMDHWIFEVLWPAWGRNFRFLQKNDWLFIRLGLP